MTKKDIYEGLDPEDIDDDDLELMEKPKDLKPLRRQEKVIRKRYVVFSQNPRLGIADGESGEVIAEGDVNAIVLETLASILERLERIETNIGSFVGK